MNNLASIVWNSAEKFSDAVAMKYKDKSGWHQLSYSEVAAKVKKLAAALIKSGLKAGDKTGIYSQNRPEWSMTDFATLAAGGITVPVYATNSAAQLSWIINDAAVSILFVDDEERLERVLEVRDQMPSLTQIVVFDHALAEKAAGLISLDDFAALADDDNITEMTQRSLAVNGNDLASIIYTSGTTGEPKGVMLSHLNFDHQIRAVSQDFIISTRDRSLCFLPLSHVYERSWSYFVFTHGACNSYVTFPKEILSYLKEVRPTIMVSVPRLYEKIYSAVLEQIEKASSVTQWIFDWSIKIGTNYSYKKLEKRWIDPMTKSFQMLADRLVLHKIRDVMGGPKNFMSAGGASLSKEIETFFFAAGLLICQGYGLTESSPLITANTPNALKFGSVGRPGIECQIRIADNGEILAKGPNIMLGYYKNPEATAETIKEGWLHTGDVGFIDNEGFLHITDRIKDLIITSGGKNIAPQRIETLIGQDFYIEQMVAIGEGRKFISALIVPNFEALEKWAANQNIQWTNHSELISHGEVIHFYNERIQKQSGDLGNYEKVKKFTLLPEPFSMENGEITPSLKIKRKAINEKYRNVIDQMYA